MTMSTKQFVAVLLLTFVLGFLTNLGLARLGAWAIISENLSGPPKPSNQVTPEATKSAAEIRPISALDNVYRSKHWRKYVSKTYNYCYWYPITGTLTYDGEAVNFFGLDPDHSNPSGYSYTLRVIVHRREEGGQGMSLADQAKSFAPANSDIEEDLTGSFFLNNQEIYTLLADEYSGHQLRMVFLQGGPWIYEVNFPEPDSVISAQPTQQILNEILFRAILSTFRTDATQCD